MGDIASLCNNVRAMQDPLTIKPPFNPDPQQPCVCGSGLAFAGCCGRVAAERPPPAGVHLVEGFVNPTECARWVRELERQPRSPLAVHHRNAGQLETRMSEGRVTEKVRPGDLASEIHEVVREAFRDVVPDRTGDAIEWFEAPQVLRYEPGGQYGRHADADHFVAEQRGWIRSIDRDYSLLLYLNEEFAGGALSFFRYNYRYRPRCGDLLIFPSDNRFVHQAEPVREGIRYCVVSWAACLGGPRTGRPPPPGITRMD
jgi:hypothetical protein